MTVRELISKVRDKLQDTEAIYWSDSEILDLYNECKRYLAAERQENPTYTDIELSEDTYTYIVDGVLRYIDAKDSKGNKRKLYADDGTGEEEESAIIVQDYNRIYVNKPEDNTSLTIKHISFPEDDNLNDTIRMGDEESYKYFIISKCYEKDNDMEQFQKASYFWNMFMGAMKYSKKNSNVNYLDDRNNTVAHYF